MLLFLLLSIVIVCNKRRSISILDDIFIILFTPIFCIPDNVLFTKIIKKGVGSTLFSVNFNAFIFIYWSFVPASISFWLSVVIVALINHFLSIKHFINVIFRLELINDISLINFSFHWILYETNIDFIYFVSMVFNR